MLLGCYGCYEAPLRLWLDRPALSTDLFSRLNSHCENQQRLPMLQTIYRPVAVHNQAAPLPCTCRHPLVTFIFLVILPILPIVPGPIRHLPSLCVPLTFVVSSANDNTYAESAPPDGPAQPTEAQMSQPQPDPVALNVAAFLRDHKLLKQRSGSLQGSTVDFFRYKRAERALLSDEYKLKSSNPKNQLPVVTNADEAKAAMVLLIRNRLLLPGKKLHTAEAREQDIKPVKGLPAFIPLQQASLNDDDYYVWFYKKSNPWDRIMGFGILVAVFTVVLFPLWPLAMRRGVWYLSMALLGFVALIMVIAVVRLILYVATYLTMPRGLWIFPNLFEDVGFFESFKPFYAWEVEKKKKKTKGNKSSREVEDSKECKSSTAASTATEKPQATRRVMLEEEE